MQPSRTTDSLPTSVSVREVRRIELEQLVRSGQVTTLHQAYGAMAGASRLAVFLAAQDLDRAGVMALRPSGTCDVRVSAPAPHRRGHGGERRIAHRHGAGAMSERPLLAIQPIALSKPDAAAVRRGRLRLFPVADLTRWATENAELLLEERAA